MQMAAVQWKWRKKKQPLILRQQGNYNYTLKCIPSLFFTMSLWQNKCSKGHVIFRQELLIGMDKHREQLKQFL